jgi:hypothetical protein
MASAQRSNNSGFVDVCVRIVRSSVVKSGIQVTVERDQQIVSPQGTLRLGLYQFSSHTATEFHNFIAIRRLIKHRNWIGSPKSIVKKYV